MTKKEIKSKLEEALEEIDIHLFEACKYETTKAESLIREVINELEEGE